MPPTTLNSEEPDMQRISRNTGAQLKADGENTIRL